MRINCQRIPVYQFYTALSQLLSRVCHEIPAVVTTLIELVVRIFEAYPLQTMWFLIPLNDVSISIVESYFCFFMLCCCYHRDKIF